MQWLQSQSQWNRPIKKFWVWVRRSRGRNYFVKINQNLPQNEMSITESVCQKIWLCGLVRRIQRLKSNNRLSVWQRDLGLSFLQVWSVQHQHCTKDIYSLGEWAKWRKSVRWSIATNSLAALITSGWHVKYLWTWRDTEYCQAVEQFLRQACPHKRLEAP